MSGIFFDKCQEYFLMSIDVKTMTLLIQIIKIFISGCNIVSSQCPHSLLLACYCSSSFLSYRKKNLKMRPN